MTRILILLLFIASAGPALGQNYPTSLDTTSSLVRFEDFRSTFLTSSILSGATSASVGSTATWSAEPYVVQIGQELAIATKTGPTTISLTRGVSGTTAASHPALATVRVVLTAYSFNPLRNSVLELQAKLGIGSSPAASASPNFLLGKNGSGQTVWGSASTFGITIDSLVPSQGGNSGKYLTTNGSSVSWGTISPGVTAFTSLSDVPASYSGQALKVVRVNAGATGLEFATLAGGGDLLAANNLSDLVDAPTARTNLGLGSMATQSSGSVAITGGTGVFNFRGLATNDSASNNTLTLSSGEDLTANRRLDLIVNDSTRSLTVAADSTISGTNTGDQTITLTGDVTGTGTGSFATTIANDAVSYAKMQNISATQRVLGRNAAGSGDTEELTISTILDWLSSTQGTILYRGASGWAALGPGTSGDYLRTNGAGANPSWATVSATDPSGYTTIVKTANQDVTNAGLTNDTDFTFSTTAGGRYMVQLELTVSGNDTTGDYTMDFNVAAGTQRGKGTCQNLTAAAAVQNIIVTSAAAASTTAIVTGAPTANLDDLVAVRCSYAFTASNATTFRFRFGNSAASAGRTSRTWKGSIMRYKSLD